MLVRWHYIALGIPLILFALELRRARVFVAALLFAAIVLAASQSFLDLRIRAIRASSPVPISSLDRRDPVRVRFGMLHGVSSILLLLQTLAAAIIVARKEDVSMEFQVVQSEQYPNFYMVSMVGQPVQDGFRPIGIKGTFSFCMNWIREKMQSIHAVRSDAGQVALARADAPLPQGWQAEGTHRSYEELKRWLEEIWTDPRPTRPGGP